MHVCICFIVSRPLDLCICVCMRCVVMNIYHATHVYLFGVCRMLLQVIPRIITFLVVLVLMLFGFGHGFFIIFRGGQSEFNGWNVLLKTYALMLGEFDIDDLRSSPHYWLAGEPKRHEYIHRYVLKYLASARAYLDMTRRITPQYIIPQRIIHAVSTRNSSHHCVSYND